jgi:hypothetical protein
MDNIFLSAAIISVIFFIAKLLEMRYIDNEPKPLKVLIRDALVVYVSVVAGYFIINQLTPVIHENVAANIPMAFTDNPPF